VQLTHACRALKDNSAKYFLFRFSKKKIVTNFYLASEFVAAFDLLISNGFMTHGAKWFITPHMRYVLDANSARSRFSFDLEFVVETLPSPYSSIPRNNLLCNGS